VPIAITVEGANIVTRALIQFGQGAIRCHPYLLKEILALEDTDRERSTQAAIDAILADGAARAQQIARQTMNAVKDVVGFVRS